MTAPAFDPLAALRAEHPGLTPEAAVDLRVDRLREELAALGVSLEPPIDLDRCAAALGVDVVTVDDASLDCDGALLETGAGRFRILLNRAAGGPARRRFTLAHELVHTLVPDDPQRPRLRTAAGTRRGRPDAAVERLVDRGAARLLMPPGRFADDLRSAGMTPGGLLALAARYGVSREAVAVNAVARWPEPAAIAFVRFALRPTTRVVDLRREVPRWRVERAFHGEGFPLFLHRGLAFADQGVVARAAVAECEVGGEEIVGKDRPVRCRVAARPLGRAGVDVPGVLAVIRPNDASTSVAATSRDSSANPRHTCQASLPPDPGQQ